jgi:hypothetical protein
METKRERRAPLHFPSVPLTELPDGHSKRREIVSDILEGLGKRRLRPSVC